jgi:hypothetical protein
MWMRGDRVEWCSSREPGRECPPNREGCHFEGDPRKVLLVAALAQSRRKRYCCSGWKSLRTNPEIWMTINWVSKIVIRYEEGR